MTATAVPFIDDQLIPWESVAAGVQRKVMVYDANLMMVKVAFQTGGIGTLHQHVHTQMTYIERGSFAVTIANETRTMYAGDVFYIAPNTQHGVVCLETGVLIDVFNPMRDDFV